MGGFRSAATGNPAPSLDQRYGLHAVAYGYIQGNSYDGAFRAGADSMAINGGHGSTNPPPGPYDNGAWGTVFLAAGLVPWDLTYGRLVGYEPGKNAGIWYNPYGYIGIDLRAAEFTYPLMTPGGTSIVKTGAMYVQGLSISGNSGTGVVSLDPQGSCVATATIAAGGSGYQMGDDMTDAMPRSVMRQAGVVSTFTGGTVISVTSADTSGTIDGATITVPGCFNTSAPSNPVSFYGGNGTDATFNLGYESMGTLKIAPSGGTIDLSGAGSVLTSIATVASLGSSCTAATTLDAAVTRASGTGTSYISLGSAPTGETFEVYNNGTAPSGTITICAAGSHRFQHVGQMPGAMGGTATIAPAVLENIAVGSTFIMLSP